MSSDVLAVAAALVGTGFSSLVALGVALIKRDAHRMHQVVDVTQAKLDSLVRITTATETQLVEAVKTVDHNRASIDKMYGLLIDHIVSHGEPSRGHHGYPT